MIPIPTLIALIALIALQIAYKAANILSIANYSQTPHNPYPSGYTLGHGLSGHHGHRPIAHPDNLLLIK